MESQGQISVRLMQGNEACVEGAIAAGIRFYAGYPITPASEIAEIMSRRMPQVGGTFIQMEDEIGSMAAVLGASGGGVRAMTATSGPGFSLKQEMISVAAMMEMPVVIVNVQRGGPGIGNLRVAQMDVMQARWGAHGGPTLITLTPSSVQECYDLMFKAVQFSEELRLPVIVLTEATTAHLWEKVKFQEANAGLVAGNRPEPKVPPEEYLCYDPDPETLVPPMAPFGSPYRSHLISNCHNRRGLQAMNDPAEIDYLVRRLREKVLRRARDLALYEEYLMEDMHYLILAYGITGRIAKEAALLARENGLKTGVLRLITLWPFPEEVVKEISREVKGILVPELNLGQIVYEVERVVRNVRVAGLGRVDGQNITPQEIVEALRREFADGSS
ncbi:2-oxoacid:acceptor oxidoreductase subunit alpha [Desulfofundulus thermocisternus]|uniref:2-oxoacid:acceptor oxidoreductase subunit alpha n=1 Tax=Desulfofundulus thermocisternus TaxID=42471 RepID=UPI00217E4AB5|nr:2-oxoacid:acceptor oxidoreductase subunit alpha [Desulfofundulus thermocisternus]MCS5694711.1 2-oxoacid:acceptor oxidoreductase subunit alpha [Desulfofundulus thermocisternus]